MTRANASNGWAKEPWLLFRFTQRPAGAATRGTELVLPIPGASGAELGLSHAERAAFVRLSLEQWVVDGQSLGSTAKLRLGLVEQAAVSAILLPRGLGQRDFQLYSRLQCQLEAVPTDGVALRLTAWHPVFKSPKLWEGAQPKCLHLLQGEGTGGQAEAKVSYPDCTLAIGVNVRSVQEPRLLGGMSSLQLKPEVYIQAQGRSSWLRLGYSCASRALGIDIGHCT